MKDSAIGSLNSGLTKRREIKLKPAGEKNPRLSTEIPLREAYIRAADRIVVVSQATRINYVDSCQIPRGKLRMYYRLGNCIRASLIVTASDFDQIPASFQSGQSPFNWIIRPLLSRTWCVLFATATNQPQLALSRRFCTRIETHRSCS